MASTGKSDGGWARSPARILMWGAAAFVLLLPAIAMQFTTEVSFGPEDFIVIGIMLAAACGMIELAARSSDGLAYRLGAIVAVLAAFLLIWMNLAVGVIGSEDNRANLMFGALITLAAAGAIMARGSARGLALAMAAAAVAQLAVALIALVAGMGAGSANWAWFLVVLSVAFTGMWAGAALLFRHAARTR